MMLPSNVVPFQNGSGGGNGVFRSMQVTPSSSTPYSDATQVLERNMLRHFLLKAAATSIFVLNFGDHKSRKILIGVKELKKKNNLEKGVLWLTA